MTNTQRAIIASFVIIIEILGLVLIIFGLYRGIPTNTIYIPVGGILVIGGIIAILFVSQQKVNRNNKK